MNTCINRIIIQPDDTTKGVERSCKEGQRTTVMTNCEGRPFQNVTEDSVPLTLPTTQQLACLS